MSESEHLPNGKSKTELAIESFVDRMQEIHPNLDREEFYNAIDGCVQDALEAGEGEEESEGGEGKNRGEIRSRLVAGPGGSVGQAGGRGGMAAGGDA